MENGGGYRIYHYKIDRQQSRTLSFLEDTNLFIPMDQIKLLQDEYTQQSPTHIVETWNWLTRIAHDSGRKSTSDDNDTNETFGGNENTFFLKLWLSLKLWKGTNKGIKGSFRPFYSIHIAQQWLHYTTLFHMTIFFLSLSLPCKRI